MKTRLYTKKLPNYIKNALPDLFSYIADRTFFGDGSSVVMAFFTDDRKLMGACNYTLNTPSKYMKDGTPKLNMYIDRFEVAPKARHTGAGTQMFEFIQDKYSPLLEKMSLTHRTYDDGISCRFWTKMGFRHKGGTSYMEKKIIKTALKSTVTDVPMHHEPCTEVTEIFE